MSPGELRDFLVFDLAGVTGPIVTATLRLQNPSFGYLSSDPTETLTFFDVSTNLSTLISGTGGVTAFNDLGSGTVYGSTTVNAATNGTNVDIPLNAAGLSFLNSSTGSIAFGGAITTINFADGTQAEFNASNASLTRQLILTVAAAPDSSRTLLLLGIATLLLLAARRATA